jgi:hypothetical protein
MVRSEIVDLRKLKMNRKTLATLLCVTVAALLAASCSTDNKPITGREEIYDRNHLQFGDKGLANNTRVEPVQAVRDGIGLIHITINIRSTSNGDQYVDGFVTFLRAGQVVEKIGPKTFTLTANLPAVVEFNSTQPADDYFVTLNYAK